MAKLRGEFLDFLSDSEDFIFDNEASFMFSFGGGLSNELISVSFTSVSVKIHYVMPDGQHITDVIEAHRYNHWVDKVRITATFTIGE